MKKQPDKVPDETMLTLWMDGELDGDELARMESWAQDHPELLAERDAVQAMSASIKAIVPSSVEPPYPDFFNQRILRRVDDETTILTAKKNAHNGYRPFGSKLSRWLAFPTAAGAMALCFYLGTQMDDGPERMGPAIAVDTKSNIYTPDGDVTAAMFSSEDDGATIIVLEGLEDIPDDFEIVGEPHRGRSDQPGAMMVNTEMVF